MKLFLLFSLLIFKCAIAHSTDIYIALFSAKNVTSMPTGYFLPDSIQTLQDDHNTYDFAPSTNAIGTYLMNVSSEASQGFWDNVYDVGTYRALKQIVILSSTGAVTLVTTEFNTTNKWLMLSRDVALPNIGFVKQSFFEGEHFAVDSDKNVLAAYAVAKAKALNLNYFIYRGTEYSTKDNISLSVKIK